MSTATLYSLSGFAAIIAGICIIAGTVLNDLLKTGKGTFFNFFGALIGLFGVTGMYLWQRAESGAFDLVAYVAVFFGLALIVCIDFSGAFITPNISEDELTRLGSSAAMRNILIASAIFLVGEILFGISVFRVGIFPKVATLLFTIGFLATPVRPAYPIVTFAGLTVSGSGLIWWGVFLFSMAGG